MKILRILALALPLVLSGCTTTVVMSPAPLANDPGCAEVIVRLPSETDGQIKRTTNSQSTAAWGSPVAITLTCGLEPVMVSTLPCITAGDVDWIVDESDKPNYTFISFGRTPATAVTIDSTKSSGANVLEDLGQAVQFTKQTKSCLN
ncbi:MAG: hypothetical protein RIT12_103 [Actinomycetota bacterium]|jgi:hypothetical protein